MKILNIFLVIQIQLWYSDRAAAVRSPGNNLYFFYIRNQFSKHEKVMNSESNPQKFKIPIITSFQTLNAESRKCFNRVFVASGTAFNPFSNLCSTNHLDAVKECFGIDDTAELIQFLKTANASSLMDCVNAGKEPPFWSPTIEYPNAPAAFLTTTPEEVYSSDNPPRLDAMFSTCNQVIYLRIR